MRLIITDSHDKMGQVTAQYLLGLMYSHPNRINIAITSGATPTTVYEHLIPDVKDKNYLNHVHYYNFDEIQYQTRQEDEGATLSNLRRLFFTPAKIEEERIHTIYHKYYKDQDRKSAVDGGLDLMLMGIGADGHFCYNLPHTTTFDDATSKVLINTEELVEKVKGDFGMPDDIPEFYVTMGPRSVMSAKRLVVIANGEHKAGIIKELIEGKVDFNNPSSILKLHPNLTVIVDKEAASKLSKDYGNGFNEFL